MAAENIYGFSMAVERKSFSFAIVSHRSEKSGLFVCFQIGVTLAAYENKIYVYCSLRTAIQHRIREGLNILCLTLFTISDVDMYAGCIEHSKQLF